jgi:hypothetical protein
VLYTSTAIEGTHNVLWNGSEKDENLRRECKKDKTQTVMMETVTLSNKDGYVMQQQDF